MASMCRLFFPTPEARKSYFSFDALWRPRGAYLFLPLRGLEVNILKSSSLQFLLTPYGIHSSPIQARN